MKSIRLIPAFLVLFSLIGCIGDDIIFDTVEEELRLTQTVDTLAAGDTFQFIALFTNNIGLEEDRSVRWASSDTDVLTIDATGLAMGIEAGTAMISAVVERNDQSELLVQHQVVVADTTVSNTDRSVRRGTIRTTSSYVLEGAFEVRKEEEDLVIDIAGDYRASSSLPGLYVYLTNNPGTTQGALEIGAVEVFSGAHTYRIGGDIPLNQYNYLLYYCKPFNIKVGDGPIGD